MKHLATLVIINLLMLFLFSGCVAMAHFATAWKAFGQDMQTVATMNLSDIESRIDTSIDFPTVKNIPAVARGKFVKLRGKVSDVGLKKAFSFLEDEPDYQMDKEEEKPSEPDTSCFVLDDSIAIFSVELYPWLKDGDVVEIIGMVSHSSIFKTQKEGSDDPKIPDYEVVVAKTVKKV